MTGRLNVVMMLAGLDSWGNVAAVKLQCSSAMLTPILTQSEVKKDKNIPRIRLI